MERELHNEGLRDVTVGGTLGSGGQWGYKESIMRGCVMLLLVEHWGQEVSGDIRKA